MSSGLIVFVANLVWGWEGSGSKAMLEGIGPTDIMDQHMGTDLGGQVIIQTSQTLVIRGKSRVPS